MKKKALWMSMIGTLIVLSAASLRFYGRRPPIAFVGTGADGVLDLFVNGGVRYCASPLPRAMPLAFSHDGMHMAYVEPSSPRRIHIANGKDCSEDRVVATLEGTVANLQWSTDGSWLAYSTFMLRGGVSTHRRDPSGDWEVWGVKVADGSLMNLSDDVSDDEEPSWSPIGNEIAFVSSRNEGKDVVLVDVSSRRQRLLNVDGRGAHLAWSPAGDTLLVARSDRRDLALIPLVGGPPSVLTALAPIATCAGLDTPNVDSLLWFGTRVVAVVGDRRNNATAEFTRTRAVSIDAEGQPTLLAATETRCPAVSRDGRIAMTVERGIPSERCIVQVPVGGGSETLLAKSDGCAVWIPR